MSTTPTRLAALRKMPHDEYLKSPEWRKRRKGALAYADNRCQLCNEPAGEKPLNVHHRTYENRGAEMPQDLVVLCADCHAKHHGKSVPGYREPDLSYLADAIPPRSLGDLDYWPLEMLTAASWFVRGATAAMPFQEMKALPRESNPVWAFEAAWATEQERRDEEGDPDAAE